MENGLNFYNGNVVEISCSDKTLYKISNKGMQPKWHKDNMWFKMDTNRYEGLAETIISDMLDHSNVDRHFSYSPVTMKYKNENHTGCMSPNGLNEDEELITIYQLMELSDSDFSKRINNNFDYASPKEYISEFIQESKELTELKDIDRYYTKMFELDTITLNNDRHMNNISLVMHDNGRVYYDCGPIFDNGNAFALSHENVKKWKECERTYNIVMAVEGKPFSTDFDTQRKIFENGKMELMLYYGPEDLKQSLDRCRNIYDEQVLKFVDAVFRIQYNKYRDFFFDKNREKWKEKVEQEAGMESTENKHEIVFAIQNNKISVTPSGIMKLNGKQSENLYEVFDKGKDVFELYKKINIVANKLKDISYEEQNRKLT